jgi:glycosyltransferase involved in cell wall biosynthesis
MKILHVSDAYLPKQGGIEIQVSDLARRQAEAGHDVTVLTCAPDLSGRRRRTAVGVPGLEPPAPGGAVPELRVGIPWWTPPGANEQVYAILRRDRPDVVHAHLSVLSPLSILVVRAAARERIPVVMTLHSLWWLATPLYAIAHVLLGWGRWPVAWTAVSELAAAPLRRLVGRHGEVTVLPNGVEAADWQVQPVVRDPQEVVVVSVMRLAARKRPLALLRMVRAARRQLPAGVRLRLVIVGEGPLQDRVERTLRRYGLAADVELPGRLDRGGIRELYRRADLYIAPATLESFGIAALEARCAGLPVLALRRTGIADFIVHGVEGLLAPGDRALARELARVAGDAELRERLTTHNRSVRPEAGWGEVLQRCELAYKSAIELSPSRREPARR